MSARTDFTIPLEGAGGEPVDLWRTLMSHGVASLPPMEVDEDARTLATTLPVGRGRPRTVHLSAGRGATAKVEVTGSAPSARVANELRRGVRHVFNLDQDLSEFYALVGDDPDLSWAAMGAGRMLRSPTVFEEVVKTVCTTNCAWSATVRMTTALVQHLGEPAVGAPKDSPAGRTFPTPDVMAAAPESFYRDVVRAGYRGPYFQSLARGVAGGDIELEAWGRTTADELSDAEIDKMLQSLPGVGPYAAAHIMMMLGRHSNLILDSWTRPKYARLIGKKKVSDATIVRRFRRYGRYAGLAFWLFLTRDWVPEP